MVGPANSWSVPLTPSHSRPNASSTSRTDSYISFAGSFRSSRCATIRASPSSGSPATPETVSAVSRNTSDMSWTIPRMPSAVSSSASPIAAMTSDMSWPARPTFCMWSTNESAEAPCQAESSLPSGFSRSLVTASAACPAARQRSASSCRSFQSPTTGVKYSSTRSVTPSLRLSWDR